MSNLPPGHPTGVEFSAVEVTCTNGHRWIQHRIYDREVNATEIDEGEEICPVCGNPFETSSELIDSEFESRIAVENERETDHLYGRYVSNGFADSDGYYAPITREAFGQLGHDLQEIWAR